MFQAKRRAEVEKLALDAAILDEERKYQIAEEYEFVTISLAPFAAMVTLDGTMYFHGSIMRWRTRSPATLEDVMARTWEHQNEIQGQRRKGDVAWEATRRRR